MVWTLAGDFSFYILHTFPFVLLKFDSPLSPSLEAPSPFPPLPSGVGIPLSPGKEFFFRVKLKCDPNLDWCSRLPFSKSLFIPPRPVLPLGVGASLIQVLFCANLKPLLSSNLTRDHACFDENARVQFLLDFFSPSPNLLLHLKTSSPPLPQLFLNFKVSHTIYTPGPVNDNPPFSEDESPLEQRFFSRPGLGFFFFLSRFIGFRTSSRFFTDQSFGAFFALRSSCRSSVKASDKTQPSPLG